jgi:hypothetical protein
MECKNNGCSGRSGLVLLTTGRDSCSSYKGNKLRIWPARTKETYLGESTEASRLADVSGTGGRRGRSSGCVALSARGSDAGFSWGFSVPSSSSSVSWESRAAAVRRALRFLWRGVGGRCSVANQLAKKISENISLTGGLHIPLLVADGSANFDATLTMQHLLQRVACEPLQEH